MKKCYFYLLHNNFWKHCMTFLKLCTYSHSSSFKTTCILLKIPHCHHAQGSYCCIRKAQVTMDKMERREEFVFKTVVCHYRKCVRVYWQLKLMSLFISLTYPFTDLSSTPLTYLTRCFNLIWHRVRICDKFMLSHLCFLSIKHLSPSYIWKHPWNMNRMYFATDLEHCSRIMINK